MAPPVGDRLRARGYHRQKVDDGVRFRSDRREIRNMRFCHLERIQTLEYRHTVCERRRVGSACDFKGKTTAFDEMRYMRHNRGGGKSDM